VGYNGSTGIGSGARKHPELKKGPLLEWVTDISGGGSVYWIVDSESQPTPVYRVVGDQIEDIRGKNLPPAVQKRYNARRNAIKAVLPKLNTAYGAKYNFEVLNDPDGTGFLVYALAAFTRTDAIYIGGHVRVSVSADGSTVERIDDLSRGIIENKASHGSQPVALGTAQVIDTKYPVETFIYSSNLYSIPIGVATLDGTVWMVASGKIRQMDPNLVKQVETESNKKAKKCSDDSIFSSQSVCFQLAPHSLPRFASSTSRPSKNPGTISLESSNNLTVALISAFMLIYGSSGQTKTSRQCSDEDHITALISSRGIQEYFG